MSKHRILLVDDEANVLRALQRTLADEDYELETALSGQDGLKLLDKEHFTVIVSDQRMPVMTGVEFLKRVKGLSPNTIRIILSGYVEVNSILDAINEGEVFRFVHKPWNDEELKTVIRQSIKHYELVEENRKLQEQIANKNQELEKWASELEERVAERTRELKLSNKVLCLAQDILEGLPVAVIGIGRDGIIALTNAEANRLFGGAAPPLGHSFDESLPEGLAALVKNVLSSGQPMEMPKYRVGANQLRVLCQYVCGFAGTDERVVLLAEELDKNRMTVLKENDCEAARKNG